MTCCSANAHLSHSPFYPIFLASAVAYANLLNQDWASTANKVLAAWCVLNATGLILAPQKFKEVRDVYHHST